ncbi:MAG: hypothetical protein R3A79_00985 [Nannocystaceae bacterium]
MTKKLIIALAAGLGALAVAQGIFTAGCDAEVDGDEPEDKVAEQPEMTLEERLAQCEQDRPASCPGNNDDGLKRHNGLEEGAICQFKLQDQGFWDSKGAVVDALGKELELVDAAGLLGDLSRKGKKMESSHDELARLELMTEAFGWDSYDHGDKAWMPQGISGSADANDDERVGGRKVIAVSWYNKPDYNNPPGEDKGSRLSFVDVTDLDKGAVPYEHVLLVDPFDDGGTPNFRPVRLHVGGIAWVGRYIYAVDTMKGLRLFDTSRMIKMTGEDENATGRDAKTGEFNAYGHRYAIPQVGAFLLSDDSCWHRFSFISVDKTSSPRSLLTGEFHDTDIAGKVIRWGLDGELVALTDPASGVIQPTNVYFTQESDMQGAASVNGEIYSSCSGQDGAWGKLYRSSASFASESYGWVIGPEDLMYSQQEKALWSASEFAGRRYVFAVDVGKY